MKSHTVFAAAALVFIHPGPASAQDTPPVPVPVPASATAEDYKAERERIRVASEEDHQRMMELLGIKSLREGRNDSDPNAPNAANYDEAKANPFPLLPDPLLMKNGGKVTSPEQWRARRREIIEDFDREVYGRVPAKTPSVKWEVTKTEDADVKGLPVKVKQLQGVVDNASHPDISVGIQLRLILPANAKGPVPVVMQLWSAGEGIRRRVVLPTGGASSPAVPPAVHDLRRRVQVPPEWPEWQTSALGRGWACAVISPNSIQADNGAGLTKGIIGLCNKGQPRKPDDWGALRAWAWGASRALDYFATDPAVDVKRVAIGGHSRYGKAALVAMAYDERFGAAYISSSGAGGAKLHRRDFGEVVENLAATGEYHWMAGNYLKYASTLSWNHLPVDSHELAALCAPRPVFIGAGAVKGDGWADAKGSFLAAAGASPVYELLGKKGLGRQEIPAPGTSLTSGEIAFRQHSDGHTAEPNWPAFLDFTARYFGKPGWTTEKAK